MLPYYSNIDKSNKTIYINPNFRGQLPSPDKSISLQSTSVIPRNAHINPLFLEVHEPRRTIHMNPAFLQQFQDHQHLQQQQKINEVHRNIETEHDKKKLVTYPENNTATLQSFLPESRKIICKSKNRLIREPVKKTDGFTLKFLKPTIHQPPLLLLNKRKLIRQLTTPPVVTFNKTATKFHSDSNKTKYKLDNRAIRKKAILPPTPKIKRTAFIGRYALRRSSLNQSNILSAKKPLPINKNNKKLQVLNINGLLYRSTQNSLRLKDIGTENSPGNGLLKSNKATSPSTLNSSAKQGLTIFVRGTKYVMDANKFKLTRITNSEQVVANLKVSNNISFKRSACQRIDIGGYTYISVNSAKNVLIRTTNHLSRAYLHNAKQKSLQLLTKRLVKSNIPCPIYQRIGKCAGFERGKCSKVHNKLQIVICSKFLRGECLNKNCLLSHNVSLSKMPVCKFFLQGVCVRNDCPYLHKKLSNKAELCSDFLRGFCQLAEKCDKRHEFMCPEIERNNECKTKNCIYCNERRRRELQVEKKSEKRQSRETSNLNLSLFTNNTSEEEEENPLSKRYFIEPCDKFMQNMIKNNENLDNSTDDKESVNEENFENRRKIRPKLGVLPAYIPL